MTVNIGDNSRFEGKVLQDVIPKHDKIWFRYPYLLKLNGVLMCAMLTQLTMGFDASMLNGLQSLSTWRDYFNRPTGARLGSMSNGITFGILAMTPFVSPICDRFGRRWPIFFGNLGVIVGAILQGASQDYAMFVVARFILGMGLCMSQTASPLLLSECAYPAQRGKLTSFIEPAWPVGSFFAAVITYGTFRMGDTTWTWRIPSLLQAFFPIIQCTLCLFAPESPRWLISRDRHEEAFEFFVKYHAGGNRDSELIHFQMAEVSATLEAEKAMKQSRWKQFLETPGMRHRLFIAIFVPLMMQLSGNAITSYYLSIVLNLIGVTDSSEQLTVNLCSTAWAIFTAYGFASQVDRIGRRPGFLFGIGAMMVTYIVWTVLNAVNAQQGLHSRSLAIGIIAVNFIFGGWYHLTAPFAPTYVTEVLPFSLRSKGAMLYQLCGNVAGLFNNYVNPIALAHTTWRYYIVYCCVLAAELVLVYFFFPETGGKSLEEIAVVFDGDNALVGINAASLQQRIDLEKLDVEHIDRQHEKAQDV